MQLLGLGDCNTRGITNCYHQTHLEMLASFLNGEATNLGYTMATTREGLQLLKTVQNNHYDIVIISFGLTDSWETFQYAPYVLYYPDNFLRKISRKIVKKWKKIGRFLHFKKFLGTTQVVPKKEYLANIKTMVDIFPSSTLIFLLDTLPKNEEERNTNIKLYNESLNIFHDRQNVIRLPLYDIFYQRPEYYQDKTHLNKEGYSYIFRLLLQKLDELKIHKIGQL